jgi:type I restriction enzyme, S subunit
MASTDWIETRLGQVITLQRGYDITKASQRDGPFPVISSSGPSSVHADYKVMGPGVVIGRKGSLGGVYFASGPYWPHDTTLWVRNFHGNDPRFIYYLLRTMQLEQYDVGASNPTLNRNHLHLLPVRVPPVPTQRKIALVLAPYDDLIENNRRRSEILEELAQRIYREWFVDFRYPGHEGIPPAGSELGQIPQGWVVVPLAEVAAVNKGLSYSGRFLTEHGQPMANLKCFYPWVAFGAREQSHNRGRCRKGIGLFLATSSSRTLT